MRCSKPDCSQRERREQRSYPKTLIDDDVSHCVRFRVRFDDRRDFGQRLNDRSILYICVCICTSFDNKAEICHVTTSGT